MGLSVKNGWLDEQGRVYIIFPVQEVMDALGCADNKATKLFRELEKFGLIERKRRGLGKPICAEVPCGKYRTGPEHEAVSAGCTLQCTHDHAALLPEPNQS